MKSSKSISTRSSSSKTSRPFKKWKKKLSRKKQPSVRQLKTSTFRFYKQRNIFTSYNQQANERKQREAENAQKELQDKLTEIKNNIFGDTLTENPEVAMSAFGSHRVITDRWKVNS